MTKAKYGKDNTTHLGKSNQQEMATKESQTKTSSINKTQNRTEPTYT